MRHLQPLCSCECCSPGSPSDTAPLVCLQLFKVPLAILQKLRQETRLAEGESQIPLLTDRSKVEKVASVSTNRFMIYARRAAIAKASPRFFFSALC
jgi:hypothetical protein